MKQCIALLLLSFFAFPACFPDPDNLPEDSGRWRPEAGETWHWQLTGSVDMTREVDVYDIDLVETTAAKIADLNGQDRAAICYFSAGTREDWRDDAGQFVPADFGSGVEGWSGESWLDIRSANVRRVMRDRLELASSKGCDGVEPDNVDGYDNETGFPLTREDQLDFNRFLATEAHSRGLAIGLKNATGIAADLVTDFEFAVNEECLAHDECVELGVFLRANKPVFHVEYVDTEAEGPAKLTVVCADPKRAGLSTLVKTWVLDAWGLACP